MKTITLRTLSLNNFKGFTFTLDAGGSNQTPADQGKGLPMTKREVLIQRNWKHGGSQRGKEERLHRIWQRMKQRCTDPNASDYARYGGKGVTVCGEWKSDYMVFKEWALANGYADDLTIERKDCTGSYCPENCTWIPHAKQARNKSNNHPITYLGEVKTLAEWAEITGLESSLIRYRLKVGWSTKDALTKMPNNKHKGGCIEKHNAA